jgi:hypothetical protein
MKYKINLCISKLKTLKMNQEKHFKRKPEVKVSILKNNELKKQLYRLKVISSIILSLIILIISVQNDFLFFKELLVCLSICSLLLLTKNASN